MNGHQDQDSIMFATEDKKGHAKVCLTLTFKAMQLKPTLGFKVNRWSQVIQSNMFDIFDLETVEIDTKIKFLSCLQPEIRKVMQKDVWPWFSRSCN